MEFDRTERKTISPELPFSIAVTKLSHLCAKPNWQLGWFIWLRAALPSFSIVIAVIFLREPIMRFVGISPSNISRFSDQYQKLAEIIFLFFMATLAHQAIRVWASRRYHLTLNGWLWWSFLWRLSLIQLLTWASIVIVSIVIFLSVMTIMSLFNKQFQPGLIGFVGGLGLVLLCIILANIPALGWAAHRTISVYNLPRGTFKRPRILLRLIGCFTIFLALGVLPDFMRGWSRVSSWERLRRLSVFMIAFGTGVGLTRFKSWARRSGIILWLYIFVWFVIQLLKGGKFPTVADWIFIGLYGFVPLVLLLPAIKRVFYDEVKSEMVSLMDRSRE